jgi:hypothetical protein
MLMGEVIARAALADGHEPAEGPDARFPSLSTMASNE